MYRDWEELKQIIDPIILPKELGGSITIQDLIKNFKQQIREMESDCQNYPPLIYESPRKVVNWEQPQNESSGLSGSFRKLEID